MFTRRVFVVGRVDIVFESFNFYVKGFVKCRVNIIEIID